MVSNEPVKGQECSYSPVPHTNIKELGEIGLMIVMSSHCLLSMATWRISLSFRCIWHVAYRLVWQVFKVC